MEVWDSESFSFQGLSELPLLLLRCGSRQLQSPEFIMLLGFCGHPHDGGRVFIIE